MTNESTPEHPTPGEIPDYARGYEGFGGRVGRTLADSTPEWPNGRTAPAGSPNIIVVLLDDMGFADIAPFGSEIPTPNLSQLAEEGFSLTNYHTTPVCSPARAAVLTGINPHRAGFATVANSDPGFPGVRLELGDDVATTAEVLRHNGYSTFGVGKWHLTRDALINAGADKSSWPIQRGFDQYYGSLEGLNSFFHPNQLVQDNTIVQREHTPEGYYLTDDYTDKALEYISGLRANNQDTPFFLYFAHTAMHGPLGAKDEDIRRHAGAYDVGWDEVRRRRHQAQIAAGIIPDHTPLPEREGKLGRAIPAWDDLDEDTRARYARYMEVYAAMVDSVDQSLGRITELLDTLGERENTIIVFTSDNGGTAEGGPEGTRSYFSRFAHVRGLPRDFDRDVDRDLDTIGGPRAMVHYPEGWAMASNTPFRFYKGQTYAGGVRVPLLISWPKGLRKAKPTARAGLRHHYQFATDILPTLLDLAELDHPGLRQGVKTKSLDGSSFANILRDPQAPSTHIEQYSEWGGNRGFYRDGWKIVADHQPGTPFDDGEWELYRVADDPNELHNLATHEPEITRDLAARWERAAWENTVFPLNDGSDPRTERRRPAEDALARPVTFYPGTPKLERYRSSKLTSLRSFDVLVAVDIAAGDAGVLFSHGDQGGGYIAYVTTDGRLHFAVNEYGRLHDVDAGALAVGSHEVLVRSQPLPDFRARWIVSVDGEERARLDDLWALVGMAPFSGIDIGINRGGPVHWDLYAAHGSFRYSGVLRSVTYAPGEAAPYSPAVLAELARDAADAFD